MGSVVSPLKYSYVESLVIQEVISFGNSIIADVIKMWTLRCLLLQNYWCPYKIGEIELPLSSNPTPEHISREKC